MDPNDFLDQFGDIEPAPKQERHGRILNARTLVVELAKGTLALVVRHEPVSPNAIKAVRPVLAAAYTKAYSVLPSYLGGGRNNDGLRLWRGPGDKAYSTSRENGALALRKLVKFHVDLEAVAAELGFEDAAALAAAVAALPPHQGGTAADAQE